MKNKEYIDKATKYTKAYTFEEFCNDEKTIDATVFLLVKLEN